MRTRGLRLMGELPVRRRGWAVIPAGIVALSVLLNGCGGGSAEREPELFVYAAASLREPLTLAGEQFAVEPGGCRVVVQSAGSQTLLSNLEASGRGDVFIPADASYLVLAAERGLVRAETGIAEMSAVLVINPAFRNMNEIRGWRDILESEARVVLADPSTAAIGKLVRERFEELGLWEASIDRVLAFKGTVTDVANDVALGAADATIVWAPVARQHPGLVVVDLPELDQLHARIAAGVLVTSRVPELADAFVRFLAGRAVAELLAREGYQAAGASRAGS